MNGSICSNSVGRIWGENFRSQSDQGIKINGFGSGVPRSSRRSELQGPHAAVSGVEEPFDRIEAAGCAALPGQPDIDEGIAKPVRQRVSLKAREAPEAFMGAAPESCMVHSTERHHQGRNLHPASPHLGTEHLGCCSLAGFTDKALRFGHGTALVTGIFRIGA